MKIRQYFKFAQRDFGKRKFAFVLNIIFFVVAAYLVCTVVHIANMAQAKRKIMEQMVEPDMDYFYQIHIQELNIEEPTLGMRMNQLIRGMAEIDGVAGSGMYYETGLRFEELLYNKEVAAVLEENHSWGYGIVVPDVYYAESDLLQACQVELYQGSFEEFDAQGEYIPVLVGYEYRDILPVGEIITEAFLQEKYQVVGILKENSRFFNKDGMIDGIDAYTSLDTYMVVPATYGMEEESMMAATYMNNISFYVESEKEAETVCQEIMALADKSQIAIEIKSLNKALDESEKEDSKEIQMAQILMYVVIFLAIMALTVTGMVQILTNKREYAIMLASGFRYRTLYGLILLENLLKTFLAVCLGAMLCWDEVYRNFDRPVQTVDVFLYADIPMVCTIFAVFALVVTIVPSYLLSKIRISQLI